MYNIYLYNTQAGLKALMVSPSTHTTIRFISVLIYVTTSIVNTEHSCTTALYMQLYLSLFPIDCQLNIPDTQHVPLYCGVNAQWEGKLIFLVAVLGLENPTYLLRENNTAYQLTLKVLSTSNTILRRNARLRVKGIPGTACKSING